MESNYKLIYFEGPGVYDPIRSVLKYCKVKYESEVFSMGKLTDEKKTQLKLPFGQLPVMIIDGQMLSQFRAIMRFLAKRFSLAGENEWESAKCDGN